MSRVADGEAKRSRLLRLLDLDRVRILSDWVADELDSDRFGGESSRFDLCECVRSVDRLRDGPTTSRRYVLQSIVGHDRSLVDLSVYSCLKRVRAFSEIQRDGLEFELQRVDARGVCVLFRIGADGSRHSNERDVFAVLGEVHFPINYDL